jgi:hypothetical protein
MGKFAQEVRRSKILGPTQRAFVRSDWESHSHSPSLDNDDLRLLAAGCFFDDLLSFIRAEKKLSELPLTSEAIIRLVVAIITQQLFRLSENVKIDRSNANVCAFNCEHFRAYGKNSRITNWSVLFA